MTFKADRKHKPKAPKLTRAEREQAERADKALRTLKAKLRALVDRTRVEWQGEPNRSEFGIGLDPGLIRFFFSVMAEAGARKEAIRARAVTLEAAAAVQAALPEGEGEPSGGGSGGGSGTEAFKKFLSEPPEADKVSREDTETESPCPGSGPCPSGGDLGQLGTESGGG